MSLISSLLNVADILPFSVGKLSITTCLTQVLRCILRVTNLFSSTLRWKSLKFHSFTKLLYCSNGLRNVTVPLHLRPLLPLQSVSLARQKAYHGTVGTRPNRNDGKDGMTVRQKRLTNKVQKQYHTKNTTYKNIKHDTEMHLTSAMNAWPSEQRCMGWTQWAAHEDRHLVPSLELTQEETGFVKNRLLQLTNICYKHPWNSATRLNRVEAMGGLRFVEPWSVHPSLQLPDPTTHFTIA